MTNPQSALIEQMKGIVIQRVAQDDVPIPVLPQVIVNALKVLRRPEFDMSEVAHAIEPDPLITARVLRLANSAAFLGRSAVLTISQAAARVGGTTLETFLVQIAADGAFASRDPAINRSCRGLWQHSVAVGLLARDLAGKVFRLGHGDVAEAAYMAGLLHDIGKPILAAVLLDAERRLMGQRVLKWLTPDSWLELVAGAHRTVGLLVAAKWDLPVLVRRAIDKIDEFEKDEPYAVANFVRLANGLAKRSGIYVGDFDEVRNAALIDAGCSLLGFTPQVCEEVCDGLAGRVADRLV